MLREIAEQPELLQPMILANAYPFLRRIETLFFALRNNQLFDFSEVSEEQF